MNHRIYQSASVIVFTALLALVSCRQATAPNPNTPDTTIKHDTTSHDTTTNPAVHFVEGSAPPLAANILGMCWASDSIGYACGLYGVIYKTTDGGNSWNDLHQSLTQNDLYSICFDQAHPSNGVAGGFFDGAVILITNDGGATWTRAKLPAGIATIRGVYNGLEMAPFCYAVGSDSSGHGVILYTNNPNYQGNPALTLWAVAKSTPHPLYGIWAGQGSLPDVNSPMIVVGDAGQVFVATSFQINPDSAQWTDHSIGSQNLRAVSGINGFATTTNGTSAVAIADNGNTLCSSNGGQTWTTRSQQISSFARGSAAFVIGTSEAFISGSNIAHTTDGGITWSNVTPVSAQSWTCISGYSGRVAFLSDAGLYWYAR